MKFRLIEAQKTEITEHHIYMNLARIISNDHNKRILESIASDEMSHYQELHAQTKTQVLPDRFRIFLYSLMARVLGITFTLRLMENKENKAIANYRQVADQIPDISYFEHDEEHHEQELIGMLNEERLKYAGSVVLGLNDALVELTGAIAGFTLALGESRLIALVALVTGVSATLSMAASEYLSTKTSDELDKHPLKAALYTGAAYSLAVIVLVFPFLVTANPIIGLVWTLINALLLILLFTFYISVARGTSFMRGYVEMAGISLGVAAISFLIGLLMKRLIGVDL